jgi:hypothetical protein
MTPDYQASDPKRSLGNWIALLIVWAIGLCVWAGYVAVLFVGFLRVFSG